MTNHDRFEFFNLAEREIKLKYCKIVHDNANERYFKIVEIQVRNDSGYYQGFEIVYKLVHNFENCNTDVIPDERRDRLHLGFELLVMQ